MWNTDALFSHLPNWISFKMLQPKSTVSLPERFCSILATLLNILYSIANSVVSKWHPISFPSPSPPPPPDLVMLSDGILNQTASHKSHRVPPNIRSRSHRLPENSSRSNLQNLFQIPRRILTTNRRNQEVPFRAPFNTGERWLAGNLLAIRARWFRSRTIRSCNHDADHC